MAAGAPPATRPEVIAGYETLPPRLLLALSDERAMYDRRIYQAEVRGFDRGRRVGYDEGRDDEYGDWVHRGRIMHDLVKPAAYSRTYQELEILRYGPRGWKGTVPDGLTPRGRRLWLAALPDPSLRNFPGLAGSGAKTIPDGDMAAFRAGQAAAEVAYSDERAAGASHRTAMRAALAAAAKAAAL